VQELSNRVEELEDALKAARSTPSGTSPESEILSAQASSGVSYQVTSPTTTTGEQPARDVLAILVHPAPNQPTQREPRYKLSRCQLGNNWYFKGVGILSSRGREWISEGAGQRVFLDKFDLFGNRISARPDLISILPVRSRTLPPEFICRRFVDAFLESKTSKVFPVLDRDLLEGTVARAHDTKLLDPESQTSAEACLWAMLAFVGRTEEAEQTDSIPGPYECANEAKRLLFIINGSVNLDSLQATLLLVSRKQ
jgi:hypothetical protein